MKFFHIQFNGIRLERRFNLNFSRLPSQDQTMKLTGVDFQIHGNRQIGGSQAFVVRSAL